MKHTFPILRKVASERDVTLTELDLRWGITEEEAKKGKVVEICLREIENSIPFFIGIIGNRYGWVPAKEDLGGNVTEASFLSATENTRSHLGGDCHAGDFAPASCGGLFAYNDDEYSYAGSRMTLYIKDTLKPGTTVTTTQKDNYIDTKGGKATIPEGFKVSTVSTEQTIDDGLVVSGPDNSQFVWIPVNDINKMIMCKSHSGTSQCNIKLSSDGTYLYCANHSNSQNICSKLYVSGTTNYGASGNWTPNKTDQTYPTDPTNAYTFFEPYFTTLDSTAGLFTSSQLTSEYKQMAVSVAKYKGFFVGRYEASLVNNKTKVIARQTPMTSWTDSQNSWYGLYTRMRNYSSASAANSSNATITSTSVKSDIIWGCQYDQMLLWMNDTGIDAGNTWVNNGNRTAITGCDNDGDIFNNIYDLAGCFYESTWESANSVSRVHRGGKWETYGDPLVIRRYDRTEQPREFNGVRPMLYIK